MKTDNNKIILTKKIVDSIEISARIGVLSELLDNVILAESQTDAEKVCDTIIAEGNENFVDNACQTVREVK